MIRNCLRGLGRAALLLWMPLATAEVVPDLYQASVAVAEQSAPELRRAAGAGLAEVLVRVSGRADAGRSAALASALADAQRYLDQYRYERGPAGAAPWLVQLHFPQDQIDRLLRGAGLPVWGADRPGVLVWLAVDDAGQRSLVTPDSQPELAAELRRQAQRRGLPLHFPSAEQAGAVAIDAIWQLDVAGVQAAVSARPADTLLLGRIARRAEGGWHGGWTLAVQEQRSSFENAGAGLPEYFAPGLDRIADTLGAQYALAGGGTATEGLMLRLVGIETFDDYARALAQLQRVAAIKTAEPVHVRADAVLLRLQIQGGVEQLTRQLALDGSLQQQAPPAAMPTDSPAAQLQYRWAPARN